MLHPRRANTLVRQGHPDGTTYRWALTRHGETPVHHIYGQDLQQLASECRREGITFHDGDTVTTVSGLGPFVPCADGDYRDEPVGFDEITAFVLELVKIGAYRKSA